MSRFVCLLILSLVPVVPAAADWLQTREGALVETKGAWRVRGSLVIFTATNGVLSSIGVSEVDLDASALATAEAKKPPPVADEETEVLAEREPVMVLTNKDVSRAVVAQPEKAEEGGDGDASTDASDAPPPASSETVTVVSWQPLENSQINGLEIVGTIQNRGRDIADDLSVSVSLADEEGESLGTVNAFLGDSSLAPRSTTSFRALFPDLTRFSGEPVFKVRHHAIHLRATRPGVTQ